MVLSLDRFVGKAAIVTGASSGIGKAIAEDLVKSGLQVVGVARRVELVQKLSEKLAGAPGKLYPFQADVTEAEDIYKLVEWTRTNVGPIHVLINNAGWAFTGSLIEGNEEDVQNWRKVLDLNVLGLCIATREVVKNMRENGVNGHVVHINSIAGHYIPNHGMLFNVYPASKHAVTALTETLRQELNGVGSKIKVTSISPGATVSELTERFKDKLLMINEEDVADAVHYVLSTPEHVQVHELQIRPVGEPY